MKFILIARRNLSADAASIVSEITKVAKSRKFFMPMFTLRMGNAHFGG
jgi:hypothetical protein